MSYPAKRNPDGTWTPYGRRLLTLLALLIVANIVSWSYVAHLARAAEPTDGSSVRFGRTTCLPTGETVARIVAEDNASTVGWATAPWEGDHYGTVRDGIIRPAAGRVVKRFRIPPGQLRYVQAYDADDLTPLLGGNFRGLARCTR